MDRRFLVAGWMVLALALVGAAMAVVQRQPVVSPAWASDNGETQKDGKP